MQASEEICLELALKSSLAYCYWHWADLDAAENNQPAREQKLQQALALFTELNMPSQCDDVQTELDQLNAADA